MQTGYPAIYLYRRIVQAKLFIDEHYASPLALNNTSAAACFSKFHFIRAFKKIYGSTPHQYLITVRLKKAEAFLRSGCSVSEACYSVGFESASSFSALFKRRNSMSPSSYLRRQQTRTQAIAAQPMRFIPGCFAESSGWKKKSNFEEAGK